MPRKKKETLGGKEEGFRLLYEEAPISYQSLDNRGIIVDVNRIWLETLGYSRKEVIGRYFGDFLTEPSRSIFKEAFPRFKKKGEIHSREFELRKKDGSRIVVSFEGRIGHDEKGKLLRTHCVFQDIMERKQTEKALRESEEKFAKVFQSSPDAVMITRLTDGYLVEVNEAFSRISGYERNEAIGHGTLELDLWANPADREQYVQMLKENGRVTNFETTIRTKSGEICSVLASSEVIQIAGEDYMVSVVHDITERKRVEQALRESEERYCDLVEHSLDLICTHDLEGTLLSVNPAAARLSGFSEEELVGMNLKNLLVPEFRSQFVQYIAEIQVKGLASGLMLVKTKGGEKRLWEYHNTLKTEGIEVPIVRGTARDVTERNRAEEELSRYRKHLEELFQTRTLELEKSLSLIRATLDSTADGIIVTDMEQRVQAWNSRFLEVLSIPPELMEQWVEGNFFRHLAQQMVNPQPLKEKLERLNIDPYETSQDEFIFKGSQLFECYIGPQKLIDEVIGHVWSFRDITERRQAERALHESERKYKGLAESLEQVVYRSDPDTLEENYINSSVLKVYGYTVEEWLSDPFLWKKIVHPEDKEWVDALFEEAKAKREGGSIEYRIIRKDGTAIWVSDNFSWEKDREGNIVSMNGIVYDITEHRKAGEKLRKYTDELEKFNRAMVDREKRIVEMKKEVNSLCRELGREPEYPPIWEKEKE